MALHRWAAGVGRNAHSGSGWLLGARAPEPLAAPVDARRLWRRTCLSQPVPAARQEGPAGARSVVPPPRRRQTPAVLRGVFTVPKPPAVPPHIERPPYASGATSSTPPKPTPMPFGEVKSPSLQQRMRDTCRLAAEALAFSCEAAREGVTTAEVDRIACEYIIAHGGYPAGIGYHGFPRGICASPNEVVVHGIPNTRPLESGDIVNFDLVAYRDGVFGDCSRMVCVGEVDAEAQRLVHATRECLYSVISRVGPGVPINSIGQFCDAFARERGFDVVAEYTGHFIGTSIHMKPNVHHVPLKDDGAASYLLRPGNTFTIEPILVEGGPGVLAPLEEDGWTILSKNGGWSAQWEHTVLVTENGVEVLTEL